jgi:hypothetical protein
MSAEHLVRKFYSEMHRIHTQPGNVYDAGDHLYHLTVHKPQRFAIGPGSYAPGA